MSASFEEMLSKFEADNPDIETYEVFIVDLNGVVKGKWIPKNISKKIANGGARMPRSTYAMSIYNDDVDATGLGGITGDPDVAMKPLAHTLKRITWADRPTGQVMMQLMEDNGDDIPFNPRAVLSNVVRKAVHMGITPVSALELECYLTAAETDVSGKAMPPDISGKPAANNQVYDLDRMRFFAPVYDGIRDACAALDIPAETALSEFGPGQLELNLKHVSDPVLAADQCVMLKRCIRSVAMQHGYNATFMPKPYADAAGSGLHLHMSMLNSKGENIFDSRQSGKPNDSLRWAIGGQAQLAPELMLLYAPTQNSYRRMIPNEFAPITTSWGLDDRTVALRMPAVCGQAARFENRIAGSNANPYLLMAAILGSALYGIENRIDPGEPAPLGGGNTGNPLPRFLNASLNRFQNSEFVSEWLGAEFKRVYSAIKQEEIDVLAARVSDVDHHIYLRV